MKKRSAAAPPEPRRAAPPSPPAAGVLPGLREILAPRGIWLVPLLLLLVSRLVTWRILPLASEDAYITFRFARNLASGNGLVYNPGTRVFGFSSPLWTLWSALGYALLRDPVIWTRLTSLIADVLTLLLVGRLLERSTSATEGGARSAAATFVFFFAAWPYFSVVSSSGMENSAMLTLAVAGALLARAGSPLTGPALGALALWRPEGVAAAAVLALGARWRDRVVGLLVFLAGLVALGLYFGSPVPQSVLAKSQIYGMPGPWAGRAWWQWALPLSLPNTVLPGEGFMLFPLAILFAPSLVAGTAFLWRRRGTALGLFVGACLAVWLGYVALGVAYFYWYLVVPLAGLTVVAATGLPRIVRGRAIYAWLAVFVLSSWSAAYPLYVGRAQNEYFGFANASEFLRRYARPGQKVLLEPIGIIGYRCPLRVVDEVGLVSPAVARRRAQGPGWYADVTADERPDWIVVRRGVLSSGTGFAGRGTPFRSPAERDSLLAHYELAARMDDDPGPRTLLVLQRKGP
jgi:hypothetical protein